LPTAPAHRDAPGLTALVLAGTRAGGDPLAQAAGVSHKALIEIGPATMIERVVGALAASTRIARIVIAIDRPELLAALPGLAAPASRVGWTTIATAAGPSATVASALERFGAPLVVTTADHALLEPAWIDEFLAHCPVEADVAIALARRDAVEAAAPATRRTWLRFADGDYSGCNLFLLASERAAAVVALWRRLEADRKRPLRMMRRLGLGFALRYAVGRLGWTQAAARLGALAGGVRIAKVELQDGAAAIDVDKPEDLVLVRVLASRRDGPSPGRRGAAGRRCGRGLRARRHSR
jgi:GTP:adenosylcobinamide-phosphate guanylyltransferase